MRKGQMTIWVILSAVLAGAILLFFIIEGPELRVGEEFGIEQYMHKCVGQAIEEALYVMLPQGGFLEPENYKIYNDTKIEYLCEAKGYYKPCVNRHPVLLNDMTAELKSYSEPRVVQCFEELEKEAEKRGIGLDMGEMNLDIGLGPRRVAVFIERDITIRERESERTINEIKTDVLSPAYDLAQIAMKIANNEAKYCYFEYVGYMMIDRSVDISKFTMSDSTKIYTLKDKQSGQIMSIATKSCVIPTAI